MFWFCSEHEQQIPAARRSPSIRPPYDPRVPPTSIPSSGFLPPNAQTPGPHRAASARGSHTATNARGGSNCHPTYHGTRRGRSETRARDTAPRDLSTRCHRPYPRHRRYACTRSGRRANGGPNRPTLGPTGGFADCARCDAVADRHGESLMLLLPCCRCCCCCCCRCWLPTARGRRRG